MAQSDHQGPGRPAKRTPQKDQAVIRIFVHAAICGEELPSDEEMGGEVDLCARLIREIRLGHGLNRPDVKAWRKQRTEAEREAISTPFLAYMPNAGVWLILGVILQTTWRHVLRALKMPKGCAIAAHQFVLTVILSTLVGIRRLSHLDDLRDVAQTGLALFTGRVRLLSDSRVWHISHTITPQAIQEFYTATACTQLTLGDQKLSGHNVSFDDHVVASFTRIKPCPLGKTKVASRGRSLPAIRLYYIWDLLFARTVGLLVTEASKRLSPACSRQAGAARPDPRDPHLARQSGD